MQYQLAKRFLPAMLTLLGCAGPVFADEPATPLRVLILTGRNNHNWQETTPKLREILKAAGGIKVDTTVPPQGLTRENLANYDVILSNWNSWGNGSKEAETAWTPAVRQAYLDFVRNGKGHVTVHAGGSSFYEGWPEYRQVSLVYWNLGVTGHGRPHEFKIRIDKPDHAVVAPSKEFAMVDELWNQPGVVEGATVVASAYSDPQAESRGTGNWEPSAVVADYGQGRCFATLLGHDAKMMENEGFQQMLICGVRWAARNE